MRIIEQSPRPLMVREIYERAYPKPNLSTVYRALDFLEGEGLVKFISFSSEGKFYHSGGWSHRHFLFCKECSRIEEFRECFAERVQKSLESETDFKITDHFFYFTGICDQCRKSADAAH